MLQSSLEILLDMRRKAQALLDADKEAVEAIQRANSASTWTVSTASDCFASRSAFDALVGAVTAAVRQDLLKALERNDDGFRQQVLRALRLA